MDFTTPDGTRHHAHPLPRASDHGHAAMIDALRTRGWCFVELDEVLRCDALVRGLGDFFAQDDATKRRYTAPFSYGYSRVDHKEGLRLLTGSRLARMSAWIPPELAQSITAFARVIDTRMLAATIALCKDLFGCTTQELAERADLPAGYTQHFGMLDAARYFNARAGVEAPAMGADVGDVNCVPHYDPGLFSLSFFSSTEGLQLQDPATGAWIDGPVNTRAGERSIGVLWTGAAAARASHGAVRAGVHRVVYPRAPGERLTLWYEMPTIAQVAEPLNAAMSGGEVVIPNLPGAAPMRAAEGEKVFDFLLRVERTRGLPMSKIVRLDDGFKKHEWPALPEDDEP